MCSTLFPEFIWGPLEYLVWTENIHPTVVPLNSRLQCSIITYVNHLDFRDNPQEIRRDDPYNDVDSP